MIFVAVATSPRRNARLEAAMIAPNPMLAFSANSARRRCASSTRPSIAAAIATYGWTCEGVAPAASPSRAMAAIADVSPRFRSAHMRSAYDPER